MAVYPSSCNWRSKKHRKLDVNKHKHCKPSGRLLRLTVIWACSTGEPYRTSGFLATASTLSGELIQTAKFNRRGVVIFSKIKTPTKQAYVVKIYSCEGNLVRRVVVPRGNDAFVIVP
ncbi:hypothetical protein [Paenibacillus sp. J22TS3]|uniref:hypothetical protein n=1 Tax=Paenibacillus sp. J22TS3 TaxID=2807192 RepID=UPI001B1C7EAA|nr:hypothetical protein [Paenibacillus sp. J22TS3]GIP23964.1 hypothetical protein J22TS3_42390 [Paenibacillus sp. J22TS3]